MQWVRLLHQRSSKKKKRKEKKRGLLDDFEFFFFFFFFCKAETGLGELVSRHPFWCRDLAEVRTEGS